MIFMKGSGCKSFTHSIARSPTPQLMIRYFKACRLEEIAPEYAAYSHNCIKAGASHDLNANLSDKT